MLDLGALRNKQDWQVAAALVCRQPAALAELMAALRHPRSLPAPAADDLQRQQRAGFVLLHVHRACPEALEPHLATILSLLDEEALRRGTAFAKTHPSLPRQVFTVLQDRRLDEELAGRVFAEAVDYFSVTGQPIAVRARALDCAANVARQYPGLWPEVVALAESIDDTSAAGLLSLKRRLLAEVARGGG